MTILSLNKAASAAGVAKSTVFQAIESGRMSAEKNSRGHWQIDPAELFRVFPQGGTDLDSVPIPNTPQIPPETKALQVEVKLLREQIQRQDAERDRERLQHSEQIADYRQSMAILKDLSQGNRQGGGLWARLFG